MKLSNFALNTDQIDQFVEDGYARLDGAFAKTLADRCREMLWLDTGCNPNDPSTWTRPVVRVAMHNESAFLEVANSRPLVAAFDDLVGPGRWQPMRALGTFPVRFPSHLDPGDTGWHVDASFGTEVDDFMEWRVNVQSRGRALLLLFLFSDVGPSDAPTLIRTGSRKEISRLLSEYGDNGMTLRELGSTGFSESSSCAVIEATGPAGTVYLCHPFLVHAGQANRGQKVRFIAQPPLVPVGPLDLRYPVSLAIQRALR